ncbi:NUDIX hydrolase [Marinagarivorans cellulosilyticus]|uniref:Nudix hydrolase domain-containing protein n=1 Tax=Marinagarivorans cellulosilyticus TaxID=2721545 RepID=A0AAN2BLN1_9GAMM|nr:NUDIX hydrolase [Marinagarivorans cellulosilyticus]BCD99212.1 hypothetical protein MARGE09_P3413 [Marinagarivorans cellulosilyticus]
MAANYCHQCGGGLHLGKVAGDGILRLSCERCDFILYENPKNICCGLVVDGEKLMLCKRAIEPRIGRWTLPGGYMECGETSKQAVAREVKEETGADVSVRKLVSIVNASSHNQVFFYYSCELQSDFLDSTPECLEVRLFNRDELEGLDYAFSPIKKVVHYFLSQQDSSNFDIFELDV